MQKVTLAPNIVIKWNPVTDDGQVRLDFREFVVDPITSAPTSYADIDKVDIHFDDINTLAMRIAPLGGVPDPVTGETLPQNMSGAAIMFSIKRLVDTIIREKLEQRIRGGVQPMINNPEPNEFVVDMSNNTFIEGDALIDYSVDWGDDTAPDENVTLDTVSHTYADVTEMTEYTITVTVNTQMLSGIVFEIPVGVSPAIEEPTPEPIS